MVRTRRGRRLELPELRPLVGLGVALDGELVAGAGRMADFYSVAPALAARRRTTTVTFVAFDVTFLGADLASPGRTFSPASSAPTSTSEHRPMIARRHSA